LELKSSYALNQWVRHYYEYRLFNLSQSFLSMDFLDIVIQNIAFLEKNGYIFISFMWVSISLHLDFVKMFLHQIPALHFLISTINK